MAALLVCAPARAEAAGRGTTTADSLELFGPDGVGPGSLADDPPLWLKEPETDLDSSDLLEVLTREAAAFRANPIDLNTATAAELARLPVLDPASAATVVRVRDRLGVLSSLDELVGVGMLSPELVRTLRPYVTLSRFSVPSEDVERATAYPSTSGGIATRAPRLTWSVRTWSSVEFDPDDCWAAQSAGDLADAARSFARLRLSKRGWSAGLAVERDPWEDDALDHVAMHLSFESGAEDRAGRLAFTVGDVLVDWGQGLLAASGAFSSVGSFPRSRDRSRGYDGAGESGARRGVSAHVARGVVSGHLVATMTRLDAAIEDGLATSIRTTGHHRTESERSGRDALSESCLGGRVVASLGRWLDLGAAAMSFGYSPALGAGDPVRQAYRFHGEGMEVASLDVRLRGERWRAGAECAATSTGGRAFVVSARLRQGRVAARVGCGHLSREYWAPMGGGLPGASGGTNGTSAWAGVEYRATDALRARADAVVAGRPWRSYHDDLPDTRQRVSVGAEVRLPSVGTLDYELRSNERSGGSGATEIASNLRNRLTLRTRGPSRAVITLVRSRSLEGDQEVGRATALGARWESEMGERCLLSFGATSANISGQCERLVTYEADLPGRFALRTLNASGTRWYIRLTDAISEWAGLTGRISGGPTRGRLAVALSLDLKG